MPAVAMRLPQRFKRVPTEDPTSDQGTVLPAYPSQSTMGVKNYEAGDFDKQPPFTDTETTYAAGTWNSNQRFSQHENARSSFVGRLWGSFADNFLYGWRAGLVRSFLLCLGAFIINISIYAWLYSSFKVTAGTATCLTATCGRVRWANTAIHAGLNIISTLVLGASTYALQGLCSPTRKEVDAAHSKKKWLEIGTASVRNLLYVRRRNVWIWVLLAITSLPFHLL